MEDRERELIERAQTGDHYAFDSLVRMHDKRVLQIAYSMLNNREDAEDVYQEAFMRAFSGLSGFRFESSFHSWLGRIVVNLSINKRKQRTRKRMFSIERNDEKEDLKLQKNAAVEAEAPDRMLSTEFREHIHRRLDELPETQRTAFTLKHIHGYKIKEISGMMNCAEGTVKNYIFRASQKLRKKLTPYHKDAI